MRTRARSRCEAGFNLIEVLIAMALLSTVLLSVVTLFYMGRSNVYSGKQLTRATSVTVHASEDLNALPAKDFFDAFAITSATTTAAAGSTVAGINYPSSFTRSTGNCTTSGSPPVTTCTDDARGYLARWYSYLTPDRMTGGKLTLVIMPSDYADTADVTTARLVKIRLVTEWNERNRPRTVVMDTTKFNRSLQ